MFTINGHELLGWHDGKDPLQEEYDKLRAHCDDSFTDQCLFVQFEDLYYDYVGAIDDEHWEDIFYSLLQTGLSHDEACSTIREDSLMELPPSELDAYLAQRNTTFTRMPYEVRRTWRYADGSD